MKLFWALVAILALTAAVLLLRSEAPEPRASEIASVPVEPPAVTLKRSEPAPSPSPVEEAPLADAAVPADLKPDTAGKVSTPSATAVPQPEPVKSPAPPAGPEQKLATAEPAPAEKQLQDLNTLLGLPSTSTPTSPVPTPAPPSTPVPAPSAPTTESASPAPQAVETPVEASPVVPAAKFKDFEVVPARTRATDDGWTLYDERFQVRGKGTKEDPVELSWDLLVSASETFQPRMGKKRLPERIVMLDGKHVRITGYVAFPIMAAAQNEMLSMRNMWDGCCIGVPPTPYDAIEVRLASAATGRDRFTSFGTVEGKLMIDPYIKGNWLLGLYLMEEAAISQLKEGNDPTKHGGM